MPDGALAKYRVAQPKDWPGKRKMWGRRKNITCNGGVFPPYRAFIIIWAIYWLGVRTMTLNTALAQLGTDLDSVSSTARGEEVTRSVVPLHFDRGSFDDRKDHFIERNGVRFAGTHLIIDLWGCERVDDIDHIDAAMRECVEAAGATLLHIHLHHFTPNAGVSGVAVLAESHISVHSWPEYGYAAFDVFMCGDAQPHKAVEVLERAFKPSRVEVSEHLRGRD